MTFIVSWIEAKVYMENDLQACIGPVIPLSAIYYVTERKVVDFSLQFLVFFAL